MKYHEKTLEYYEQLKNVGDLGEKNSSVGTGIVGSPLCGDVMKLQILFDEENNILNAKYKVFGCVSAIAVMELVTTKLKGMNIESAAQITNEEICDILKLNALKRHCSVLAKEVIAAAIQNYTQKKINKGEEMIEIEINEKAMEKLVELIKEYDDCIGIAIDVHSSCAGIEYSLSYQSKEDIEIANKKKIKINNVDFYFDLQFEMLINGIKIDIIDNSLGYGFVVVNSRHISSCQNCDGSCKKS